MTNFETRRIFMGFCMLLTVFALLAVTAAAQTSTTEKINTASATTTKQEHSTVMYVEGSTVVIKMSTGEMRTVIVPESRTALIDGKEITVRDLKVGTSLTATIATTTTPIVQRTTTVASGKVWYVNGPNVILTMPDGTNKMFKVTADYKFSIEGRPATVFDLRKGMTVAAQRIVEEPRTEVAANTTITGTAPTPKTVEVAQAAIPMPAPPARVAASPAPSRVAAAPTPARVEAAPTPAPVEVAAISDTLPKTGSPIPLAGVLGLLFMGTGLVLRMLRRS
jgi:LPXTG-motif cell wall-anchored protein